MGTGVDSGRSYGKLHSLYLLCLAFSDSILKPDLDECESHRNVHWMIGSLEDRSIANHTTCVARLE